MKKIKDLMIYRDAHYYSAFPAVAALPEGRLVAVFRRAPNYYGWPGVGDDDVFHGDPNSKLMAVVSDDGGEHWSEPRLVCAPPIGASQDGGLFCDGNFLYVNSFVWQFVPEATVEALQSSGRGEYLHRYLGWMAPAGSFVMRSGDAAESWEGPFVPEPLPGNREVLPGQPLRLHNRANIRRSGDGSLLLSGQVLGFLPEFHSSVAVYRSIDAGTSWQFLTLAADGRGVGVLEEPCLCITNSGKWVMLMRCHRSPAGERFERARLWVAESADRGRSWSDPCDTGIHAEPAAAERLPDGRFLVAYGYRMEPFGVRARVCNAELTDIAEAPEFIIRADGGRTDTGYPWIAPLGEGRYLVAYYLNPVEFRGSGGIFGSVVEVEA